MRNKKHKYILCKVRRTHALRTGEQMYVYGCLPLLKMALKKYQNEECRPLTTNKTRRKCMQRLVMIGGHPKEMLNGTVVCFTPASRNQVPPNEESQLISEHPFELLPI